MGGYFCVILLLVAYFNSYAIETIVIERGHVDPIPIAINKFDADDGANSVISVISNDLRISGMFHPISITSFIERIVGIKHKPLFAAWRLINLLINGELVKLSSGKLKVRFILWDASCKKILWVRFLKYQHIYGVE